VLMGGKQTESMVGSPNETHSHGEDTVVLIQPDETKRPLNSRYDNQEDSEHHSAPSQLAQHLNDHQATPPPSQRSRDGISSDTMNPQDLHNEGPFTAQFMDSSLDRSQNYLQSFRSPGGFNLAQSHSLDQIKQEQFDINLSPFPHAFGGNTFQSQGGLDFQLFGGQEPPQHINPVLYLADSPETTRLRMGRKSFNTTAYDWDRPSVSRSQPK